MTARGPFTLRRPRRSRPTQGDELIRAELFGVERLEQHAASLAEAQRVIRGPARGVKLHRRLSENAVALLAAYRTIIAAIHEDRAIPPAAEWLVDNFHLVEEQIRQARADLPPGYYRQLPKLAGGPLRGHPRIYGLAWAYVAHTDSRLDPQSLARFIQAYQGVQPLTIGELWALAITLRIVLVENLRRASERLARGRRARQRADALADRLLTQESASAPATRRALARATSGALETAFAVQLIQRLRDLDPTATPALRSLDEQLAAHATSADDLVREEHRRLGASNITVRNVITSMRLLSDLDWRKIFEAASLVDATLRDGSAFGAMDFPTRDRYRHAIEELARCSPASELEVAAQVIRACQEAADAVIADPSASNPRAIDPGYHLISSGRRDLERRLGFRPSWRVWRPRAYKSLGLSGYVGALALATVVLSAIGLAPLARHGVDGAWLAVFAALAVLPASNAALALLNRHVSRVFGPRALPALELRDGVPTELRTLVVVPTLLTSARAVEEQIEHLEVCHLANTEGDLRYALLSDWTDAEAETVAGDEELFAAAAAGIARLNVAHSGGVAGDRFLLLHRRRVWNPGERSWLGWERKRGKLRELNRWLRGATDTTFLPVGGRAVEPPPGVRYVITLDSDTRLPRGTARRLIGKLAHPLNRPQLDVASGRVVSGHAVLQPRVNAGLPMNRDASRFQRTFSGASGIDPYSFAASDVYQDVFGEGSYTGKGIYDVDAFEAALEDRVPDSTLLSHDLLEGIFARAGLVSDIEVLDEFPARFDVAAARQHRWARGDWQLLPWIFARGRDSSGDPARREIPWIGRWKMLDNLRRTLVAPAALLALVVGWMLPLPAALAWTALVLASIAVPAWLPVLDTLVPWRGRLGWRGRLRALRADIALAAAQSALLITFLTAEAWLMADAIARTLHRMSLGHKHLLEWLTADQAKSDRLLDLGAYYRRMAGGVALAAVAAALVLVGRGAWPVALPVAALWLAAPSVARWTSLPTELAGARLASPDDARLLRLIARRTWRYFESFVTSGDQMLPPDNFQEDPAPVVAHRTSPTNVGLYLLARVAARDFGWVGTTETVAQLEATLATLGKMERCRGHFLNWYDTRDLRPLDPRYVSTVDSGNLAGHLVALANACREVADQPLVSPQWAVGLGDAVALVREAVRDDVGERRTAAVMRSQLGAALALVDASLADAPATPSGAAARLRELAVHADTLTDIVGGAGVTSDDGRDPAVLVWVEAFAASVRSHARDLALLAPWTSSVARDPNDPLEVLLETTPSLGALAERCEQAVALLAARGAPPARDGLTAESLTVAASAARSLAARSAAVAGSADAFARAMEFGFLLDESRELLSIGYRVDDGTLDPSCYDLLASEARLASFIAIAKGDVPARHWFRLGRRLSPVDGGAALASWSGSMFEYLMPSLVMRAPDGSLLEHTSRLVVRRQMKYGAELGLPWGISEAAYNARDLELTYQYSNFGVPGLGLKRGLGEDAVVAPYATALAAMVSPHAAAANFGRLGAAGALGGYGYYEALDYTGRRLPEGQKVAVVRAYMAHHQGMTLVAIANALQGGAMRARFHAEPMVQATELLLQERVPREIVARRRRAQPSDSAAPARGLIPPTSRRFHSPHQPTPRTHLLSNGRYAVMVTSAGAGYSRWLDLAVTRWREDATEDGWGSFVYLRDTVSGEVWSAGYQPMGVEPDSYEVDFVENGAEIRRVDGTLTTHLEVAVSPEDDGEVRRVSITNSGSHPREIEVTSYAELVLAPAAADAAHPAFSKLFVQTEFVAEEGVLLATRRPRSPTERAVWAVHLAVVEGESVGEPQRETDRARFVGRGRSLRTPAAVLDGEALAGTTGTVLDPIFSLRRRVRIAPGTTARVAFWTLVAGSRGEALDLADKHHEAAAFERATTLAWTQAQVQLHHLGVTPDEAHLFQRLANHVLYADPGLRPAADTLARNELGPASLWPYGISGDLPIVLVRIDDPEDLHLVRQVLHAHRYFRMKQLAVDVVILNERAPSYTQDLQGALEAAARTSHASTVPEGDGARGNVFLLRAELVTPEVRRLLAAVARARLLSRRGSLSEQLESLAPSESLVPHRPHRSAARRRLEVAAPRLDLEFWNGLGGFADSGREYVTVLGAGQETPAPWINVIANPTFGCQVSAEGGGYTWSLDSRENQLSPWANDPVMNRPGEALYVRDEVSGDLWCPTALPVRNEAGSYVCRHGQGYSRFEHASDGIALELLVYVPLGDAVKISRLTIRNRSERARRLSVTAYVEWVLGSSRAAAAPFVVTEIDPGTAALLARNPWRAELGGRVAFSDLAGKQSAWSGDRAEFLGRHGTLAEPAVLAQGRVLSGRVGAGLDPCGALQTRLELGPHAEAEVVWFLGEGESREQASALVKRYRGLDLDAVLRDVTRHWDRVLGAIEVRTPDRAMDLMLDRWLLYQTLACRIWARSGFYQASGAYGFRDQLQDVMALLAAEPSLAREHLLRAAARQFVEGDVQHWWLPLTGKGVRTRISDDLVWLPHSIAHYVEATADAGVLDEPVALLEAPALAAGEHDRFFAPAVSEERVTLFEHGARALDRSLVLGAHGLPLIGGGDWNDGMNRVGEGGRGESVWLAWFLHAALTGYAPLAEARGEFERARVWREHASALASAVEAQSWDGEWYRRGYFDDGSPLGSAASDECKIDSIAQSWAVISGAGDPERSTRAMAAVNERLVRRDDRLIQLFAPPFENSPHDPGYIQGYPAGIRENGGQYTHAAAWVVVASAVLGEGDLASELFGLLNPISHASSRAAIRRYKVEPYVACADVYSVRPHVGRGGWTWYTGSAGWLYRAGLESILGFRLRGATLHLEPCIPKRWDGFEIVYRHRSARYDIVVENPHHVSRGVAQVEADGQLTKTTEARIELVDDGAIHRVRVVLG